MGLVLSEHENAAQSGMKAVAEREIDDAISSPEGHGRLGSLGSQWLQARTHSARQDDADRLLMHEAIAQGNNKSKIGGFGAGFKSFPAPARPDLAAASCTNRRGEHVRSTACRSGSRISGE